MAFFLDHFVDAGHLSFFEGTAPDNFLRKPMLACAMAALANRAQDERGREEARRYYVDAITVTNAALRNANAIKDDNTIMAVILLGCFERLNWDNDDAMQSWQQHVRGATEVLQMRGQAQLRTPRGAGIFREVRANSILNALILEVEVPDFIVQWSRELGQNPLHTLSDQLAICATRLASLKSAFQMGSSTDEQLYGLAVDLEGDLLGWSKDALADGSDYIFNSVPNLDSPRAFGGIRHDYAVPQTCRQWNLWRTLCIILARVQEAIYRRSWPTLTHAPPSAQYYRSIRDRMSNNICVAAAYVLGDESMAESARGSIPAGYSLVQPLCLAGTCFVESLVEPSVSSDGSRIILVDQPLHLDPRNQISVRLAAVIARLEMIDRLGIRWAGSVASFLKGGHRVCYDLARS
ncbi:hypothetical protein LTR53_004085 [Teratosphaeriaceae sp. CCFEE 6253]|nr:hypothetical protein LTR53_004085 [Teratosphaeriaceae sp. CCFEE 6253]